MSDYLQHLVARTLSSEVSVRPQLRSAFEPVPFQGNFTLPADFDSRVETESLSDLKQNVPAPFERAPGRESSDTELKAFPVRDKPHHIVPPLLRSSKRDAAPPLERGGGPAGAGGG